MTTERTRQLLSDLGAQMGGIDLNRSQFHQALAIEGQAQATERHLLDHSPVAVRYGEIIRQMCSCGWEGQVWIDHALASIPRAVIPGPPMSS